MICNYMHEYNQSYVGMLCNTHACFMYFYVHYYNITFINLCGVLSEVYIIELCFSIIIVFKFLTVRRGKFFFSFWSFFILKVMRA